MSQKTRKTNLVNKGLIKVNMNAYIFPRLTGLHHIHKHWYIHNYLNLCFLTFVVHIFTNKTELEWSEKTIPHIHIKLKLRQVSWNLFNRCETACTGICAVHWNPLQLILCVGAIERWNAVRVLNALSPWHKTYNNFKFSPDDSLGLYGKHWSNCTS